MDESTFKTGDVVQLKSGGPQMTIEEIPISGRIGCKWFEGGKLTGAYFEPGTLKIYKTPKPVRLQTGRVKRL